MQVLDHGVEIEALEFLGVVERLAHRIGGGRFAMEYADLEMLWPPVAVPVSFGAGERAFAALSSVFASMVFLRSCFVIFFNVFHIEGL